MKRHHAILLLVLLAVGLGAALYLLGGRPQPNPPLTGGFTELDNAPAPVPGPLQGRSDRPEGLTAGDPQTGGSTAADHNTRPPLEAPPPPPVVDNDPRNGFLWMRIIDAETNQPVANTECRCLIYTYDDNTPPRRVISRTTDAEGLLRFSVGLQEADVVLSDDTFQCPVPAPLGWYMETDAYDLEYAIDDLLWLLTEDAEDVEEYLQDEDFDPATLTRPIDIMVRRFARLAVSVVDTEGRAVEDAEVHVYALPWDDRHFFEDIEVDILDDYRQSLRPQDVGVMEGNSWHEFSRKLECSFRLRSTHVKWNGVACESDEEEDFPDISARLRPAPAAFLDLPCIEVGVVVSHRKHSPVLRQLQLSSGPNLLEVVLEIEEPATLEITVIVMDDDPEEAPGPVEVEICRSAPHGHSTGREEQALAWQGTAEVVADSTNNLLITGLLAGCYTIDVGTWYGFGHLVIELAAGEHHKATVYIGKLADAYWSPTMLIDGEALQVFEVVLSGQNGLYDQTVEYGDEIVLSPGTYTAWVPMMPPKTFEIGPGEHRTDVFEPTVSRVTFSIEAELFEMFDSDEVEIKIVADTHRFAASEMMHSLEVLIGEREPDYNLMVPWERRTWPLPHGSLIWTLHAGEKSLSGALSVTGPAHIEFGINNLPGRSTLLVCFDGYEGRLPDVLLYLADSDLLPLGRTIETLLASEDGIKRTIETVLFAGLLTSYLIDAEGNRVLIAGQPGRAWLDVGGGMSPAPEPEAVPFGEAWPPVIRWYEPGVYIPVTLPGRITLSPQFVAEHSDEDRHDVMFHSADDSASFELFGVGPDGRPTSELPVGSAHPMAKGIWTIEVLRRIGEGNQAVWSWATFQASIGPDTAEIDLDELGYKPLGSVDINCIGRGSPDGHYDAWWLGGDFGPGKLTRLFGDGASLLVRLDAPDIVMPRGQREFAGSSLFPMETTGAV